MRAPEALVRATFDSAPDGIVVLDAEGRIVGCNARFLAQWQFPPDMLARGDPVEMRAYTAAQLVDPARYLASIGPLLEADCEQVFDEVMLLDGRVYERHVAPLSLPEVPGARVVRWRDVTERNRARVSLAGTQTRLAALFDNALNAIVMADDLGRYVDANPAACQMLGYTRAELLQRYVTDLVVPGSIDVDAQWAAFLGERQSRGRVQLRCQSGRVVVAQFSAVAHMQPGVHLSILSDVTEEVRGQQRQQELSALLDLAMLGADMAYWDVDLTTGSLRSVNGHWHTMLGYAAEEIGERLKDWLRLLHPDDTAEREAAWARHLDGGSERYEAEFRLRHKAGHWVWVLVRGRAVAHDASGRPTRIVGTRMDISARKQAEQRLTSQAHTDGLTGVYNRRRFLEMAHAELARARRQGQPTALLMLDLDHFKRINDQHGHAAGDAVLCDFADTAQQVMREGDVFARLGGEEFAALLSATDLDGALALAQRLQQQVRQRPVVSAAGASVVYTVSIGVALAPAGSSLAIEPLMQQADRALYRAKAAGRDRTVHLDG